MHPHEEEERPRFYGVYRGKVVDTNDPESRGRITLRCPTVLEDQITEWAWPVQPIGTTSVDTLDLPAPGSGVWVTFEGGDPEFPIWIGVF